MPFAVFLTIVALLLSACRGEPSVVPTLAIPEEIPAVESYPDETVGVVPVEAVESTLLPVERFHVLEDIRAQGGAVTLAFRAGEADFDSIQASTTTGTLVRDGLTWRTSSTDAVLTFKVWQTLPNVAGRVVTVNPTYYFRAPGALREVTIPANIDATGRTNVCGATDNQFAKWLATVPDGSVIRGNDGRYRCDYGIKLANRWNLRFTRFTLFSNYDAFQTIDPGMKGMRMLSFTGGGNIDLGDLTIQGPRPVGSTLYVAAKETQHGLEFRGVNGVKVQNVTVRNVWGDFINISFVIRKWSDGLHDSTPTRHIEVANSTFQNSGRQGIALTGVFDGLIHDNTFADVQRSLWDFEPGGTMEWVDGVEIYNNRITGRVANNVCAGNGTGRWVQNITIRDNDFGPKPFRCGFGGGDGGVDRKNLRILRNTATVELGSPLSPVDVSGFDSVTVEGNRMVMQARRGKPAVLLQNQVGYSVSGNTAPGARVMVRWEANSRDSTSVVIEDGVQVRP